MVIPDYCFPRILAGSLRRTTFMRRQDNEERRAISPEGNMRRDVLRSLLIPTLALCLASLTGTATADAPSWTLRFTGPVQIVAGRYAAIVPVALTCPATTAGRQAQVAAASVSQNGNASYASLGAWTYTCTGKPRPC